MFAELSLDAALGPSPAQSSTVPRSGEVRASENLSFAEVEGARLADRDHGPADDRPVLLFAGADPQMTQWPEPLLESFHSTGFRPATAGGRFVAPPDMGHGLPPDAIQEIPTGLTALPACA